MNDLSNPISSNLSYVWIVVTIIPLLLFLNFAYAQEPTSERVPDWVKTTAKWYSEGKVSEKEFLNAIKFLVDSKIIVLNVKTDDSMPATETSNSISTQTPVSKPRLNMCQVLYPTYNTMSPMGFKAKYSHINYISDCINLYKDPVWNYQGDDRIEKLYQRFLEIREERKQQTPKLSTEPSVKIVSSINIGTEKFLVKFNVCAGDLIIDKAKILINSKIESVVIGSNKDIPANACRTYETQIHAKYKENIEASIMEQFLIKN